MKKCIITTFLIMLLTTLFSTDLNFCGRTILVVMEANQSRYTGIPETNIFGDAVIESVENIFEIESEAVINALIEDGRVFRTIYKLTLPIDCKDNVLSTVIGVN